MVFGVVESGLELGWFLGSGVGGWFWEWFLGGLACGFGVFGERRWFGCGLVEGVLGEG